MTDLDERIEDLEDGHRAWMSATRVALARIQRLEDALVRLRDGAEPVREIAAEALETAPDEPRWLEL